MKSKRTFLFRAGTVVLLILIMAVMMVIGRGHTIYFDNKETVYEGQTYTTPYKVVALEKGEQVAKLYDKERGMTICIGQTYQMNLEVTETKGGEEKVETLTLKLPYNMDGVIINLPAFMAGLPEEAYLTEFIPSPDQEAASSEEVVTDEFGLTEGADPAAEPAA